MSGDAMELYDVMRTTAAVRQYTDEPLCDETLHRILDNARFAPTGGNRQGVRVIAIRDIAARRALAELAVPGGQRYLAQLAHGESPWSPLAPCGVAPQNISAIDASAFAAPIRDARVVLVLCLDLSVTAALDQELDRVGVVAGASVYPFAWNVLLAARNEGFGGVLTTAIVAREPAVKDLLNIPDHFAVAAALPLGKPVRQPNRLTRKSIAEIATWDRFDGPPM
jgi:nitroreductase